MYELIEHKVLDADAASITFSNIPQIYTNLYLVLSARTTRSATDEAIRFAFNGSTSNFSDRFLVGQGSSASSGTGSRYAGQQDAATATANTFGNGAIYILNYTSSNYKSYSVDSVTENNATYAVQSLVAGLWSDTAPITSITLTTDFANNFKQYTTATLYGVGRKQAIGKPKAVGGAVTYDNGHWVHTFTGSGTFYAQEDLEVDALVVAGGGGGGAWGPGGGGGAGGCKLVTGLRIAGKASYGIAVGAGGAAQASGNSSIFSSISTTGGGNGSGSTGTSAAVGGSGGGGAGEFGSSAGAAGISGEGNSGANARTVSGSRSGGGGGGASANGSTSGSGVGGAGGAGLTSTITGASIGYAGGGGGAGQFQVGGSATDGGGAGGQDSSGTAGSNGTANRGGGGGGGGASAGAGGSGIVIVRYKA